MVQYGTTRSLMETEQQVFGAACREFASTLAPHIARCFLQIYPEAGAELDMVGPVASLKKLSLQLSAESGELFIRLA